MLIAIANAGGFAAALLTETTPQEDWLAGINLLLGIIVLFFMFLFVYWIVRQVVTNEKAHARKRALNPHELVDPQLGTVLADGGDPLVDPEKPHSDEPPERS